MSRLVPLAMAVMFIVSLMSPRGVRRISVVGLGVSLMLVAGAPFVAGAAIRGTLD